MANKKISELVVLETPTDNDVIPIVNNNTTNKIKMSDIKKYVTPSEATTEAAGLLSAEDKAKLDNNTANNHTHNNKELLDTYTQTEEDIANAVTNKHTHSNTTILDNTTASYTVEEQTKLGNIEANAQVNVIETIKLNGVEVTPNNKVVELTVSTGGGEGGTTDYTPLTNKPKINNVELNGNKTLEDLGIQPKGNYIASTVITAFWKGTQAEYDALGTYSDTTLYLIQEG